MITKLTGNIALFNTGNHEKVNMLLNIFVAMVTGHFQNSCNLGVFLKYF